MLGKIIETKLVSLNRVHNLNTYSIHLFIIFLGIVNLIDGVGQKGAS